MGYGWKDERSNCMRNWKRWMSLTLAGLLTVQMGGLTALAGTGAKEAKNLAPTVENMQIGSDVCQTPLIPDAAQQLKGVNSPEISLNETTGDGTWKYLYDIPDYTLPDGVPYPTAENQDFDFAAWSGREWKDIIVPGEPLMQGFDILTNNEYYYQRQITVPADYEGNRVLVRFDGVYCNARVWINGKYVRTHVGGFTTWDCDITEYAKPGETVTMTVGVADLYSNTRGIWNPEGKTVNNPANATEYAHHNIGGILRDVSLVAMPYDYIARTYVNTDFDETFVDANLEVTAQLGLTSEKATLKVELLDGDTVMTSAEASFDKKEETADTLTEAKQITIPVSAPKHWDAEHPNLYTLRTTLVVNGEEMQQNEERIGFREIHYGGREGTDSNKVYVNGKEVKLRGTCRHDVSDDLGRSMTREEAYAEALAYKKANINHIRTSHYPASEDLLDACDELGIYVEQETAVCFQGPWADVASKYEDYLPQFTEMIERDRNRPSILIWSLGNESNYNKVASQSGGNAFQDERDYLKDVEVTRPCIFSFPDTGEPAGFADIYSAHYWSVTGGLGYSGKPVLHDEFAHIPCYNLDELQRDVNTRNFWGESIKKGWENVFNADGGLGADLWGGIDDVFYIPDGTTERWQSHSDGQTAGYGEWGSVLDAYLREKPEAYLTKKAYSPVRVDEDNCAVSADGTLLIPVKNWFDHTNMNEVEVEYTTGESNGRIRIGESIAPHGAGTITVPGISKDADSVNLKFYTADGIMVDEYNVELAVVQYSFTPAGTTAPAVKETGDAITVSGEDFSVVFSKETGLITEGSFGAEQKVLLTGGPYLHVTGTSLGKWTPDVQNGIAVKIVDNQAVVTLNGTYDNGQGVQFTMKISGNGIIDTAYKLTTAPKTGSGLKEVGVSYDISNDMVSVDWLRDGLYSAYPQDHIGRNEGTALKVREGADENPDQYGVEPQWSWKDDMKNYFVYATDDPNNGLVTNDFKTMREYVYYYNVNYDTDKNAPRISVESADASVAARVEVAYDLGYIDDRDTRLKYIGGWYTYDASSDYAGTETYSTKIGDSCELTFEGNGVRFIGSKQKNTGKLKIYLDGVFQEEIDTYSNLGNDLKQTVIYSVDGLEEGTHTIKVETSGGHANCVVVDAFEVLSSKGNNAKEAAKLIVNNQWYYPNLGWGNYTGRAGTLANGSTGSAVIRLTDSSNFTTETVASLGGVLVTGNGENQLKVDYSLRNGDENTKVNLQWYRIAVGDPDSKAQQIAGATSDVLNTSGLAANEVYCVATMVADGVEKATAKSNTVAVGADSYQYYDIVDDSDAFTYTGTKGTDYKTDANMSWTANAYNKTVTYLLDTKNEASVTFTFTGNGIRWVGAKEKNQGIAEVTIDQGIPEEVDLYDADATTGSQVNEILYEKLWDNVETHTITISRTGRKNASSLAANVSLDAFIVINKGAGEAEAADKTLLQMTYDRVKDLSTDGVVESAVKFFESAVAEAKTVLDDAAATQEEVNAVLDKLITATWGLGLYKGDKAILKTLIDKANTMLPNEAKYVAANWPELTEKLAKGQEVYDDEDAFQEEINAAAEELLAAILNQRFKADKSNLEELLKRAEAIDTSLYTAETVQLFRAALANAKAVMADASLSESDQQIVDAAIKALADAKD